MDQSPPSPLSWEELERLRRSVAMLSPGQRALAREDALLMLAEVQRLTRELTHLRDGLRSLLD